LMRFGRQRRMMLSSGLLVSRWALGKEAVGHYLYHQKRWKRQASTQLSASTKFRLAGLICNTVSWHRYPGWLSFVDFKPLPYILAEVYRQICLSKTILAGIMIQQRKLKEVKRGTNSKVITISLPVYLFTLPNLFQTASDAKEWRYYYTRTLCDTTAAPPDFRNFLFYSQQLYMCLRMT